MADDGAASGPKPRAPAALVAKIAPLVFVSGACALVYQVAWTRELRLVFGASTAASAAVLAIFMGGLGAGGLLLGKRADRAAAPLLLYARLELFVAIAAAISPFLIGATRGIYIRAAASAAPVPGLGTALRLALAALVLGPPALLMGGTLPAAARAAARDEDTGRRDLAILYGVNTLGAVVGSALATFVLLELFGTRLMLWLACLVNLLVAMGARTAAQSIPLRDAAIDEPSPQTLASGERVPPRFALAAAAVVGFAFLLMEIVWYRMLAPVLGGSSYTFGIILSVALLGLGLGGAARALRPSDRPATIRGFALTCGLEALGLAIPYALGDRIAVLAMLLRPLGGVGLIGLAAGWSVIAAIVILPAAIASGWQFPLLVSLLGSGGRHVGRDVAHAYAWNTAGAIVGSLAGGFGLLPLLTAPGVWRAAVVLLAILGVSAAAVGLRADRSLARALLPGAIAVAAVVTILGSRGPTAAWRHSAVGAGRESEVAAKASPRTLRDWVHRRRREIVWEAEGVESSVAMTQQDGYAFLVNGKVDGHVRGDASTQIMGGLLGALLHPNPKRALVIGLGTGSSAGWLAAVPGIDRVDVVELEPAVVRVAREAAAINHGALDNPKLALRFADAREVLLTTPERYDVIFSEPSNPYRAGISSLFTREYYQAAVARLAPGGVFLQWLQAYEIDQQAVDTAFATLASVFPEVETWTTGVGDLILVATREPIPYDAAALRARIREEPYRSALAHAWRVTDLEGVLAHHLAGSGVARAIAEEQGEYLNTDDRNLLEFAFARTAGQPVRVDAALSAEAQTRGLDRPAIGDGTVDWLSVADQRMAIAVAESRQPDLPADATHDQRRRGEALMRYVLHDAIGVVATWTSQPRAPRTLVELEAMGESLADMGDSAAVTVVDRLRALEPTEADAVLARLRFRQSRFAEAADALAAALDRYHDDPWPDVDLMRRAVDDLVLPLAQDRKVGERFHALLARPFVLRMLENDRLRVRLRLALQIDPDKLCVEALAPFEPDVPWNDSLALRARCYARTNHPLAARAARELEEFSTQERRRLSTGLIPDKP
ncbi:MAG: fused MFS/spermidine synthase [Minicystis sp.]